MRGIVGVSLFLVVSSCAHAPVKSRWLAHDVYTACECVGKERMPTPWEVDSFRDDERIDYVCEGKVRNCGPPCVAHPGQPADCD